MGRGSRWAIGLVTAGLLAVGAIVSGAVAFGQVVGRAAGPGGSTCVVLDGDGYCADDQLTSTAQAEVLDVDASGAHGAPLSQGGSPGDAGSVDVQFESPDQHVVTTIPWPGTADSLPAVGDQLTVAYAPDDPENLVTVASALSGPGAPPAPSSGSAWDDGRGAGWLSLGFGLATVVALLLTWLWARRAPAPERAQPAGYPGYGYPGYGYPYAGYPSYGPPGYAPLAWGPPASGPPASAPAAWGPPASGPPTPGPAPSGQAPDGAGSAGNWPAPG
jgi:hypothetical protein